MNCFKLLYGVQNIMHAIHGQQCGLCWAYFKYLQSDILIFTSRNIENRFRNLKIQDFKMEEFCG